MSRLLFSIIILALLATACNSQKSTEQPKAVIPVSEVTVKAEGYVDQLVQVDGMVVHVCRESGKRLFLGDERFKILASNSMAKFDVALEGSDIKAIGYIRESRIDENYLDEWEKELGGPAEVQLKEEVHTGQAEAQGEDESAIDTQLRQIKEYRDQIKSGTKGYLSFYSLEIVSIEEVK